MRQLTVRRAGSEETLDSPRYQGLGVGSTICDLFDEAWGDPGSVAHRQPVLPHDGRTAIVRLS